MAHRVTPVRGDGDGPELAEATCRCIDATGVDVGGVPVDVGGDVDEAGGTLLSDQVLDSIEAAHGSAPKYQGLNKVNPTVMILSGVMMQRHLREMDAARELEDAVAAVIAEGRDVTYDRKPDRDDPTAVGTREMADAIIAKL